MLSPQPWRHRPQKWLIFRSLWGGSTLEEIVVEEGGWVVLYYLRPLYIEVTGFSWMGYFKWSRGGEFWDRFLCW